MKAFKMLKIAVLSLLFFLIPLNASINKYVISDDAVIDARTAQKILEIGSEVKNKTNVNIYVYAKTDLGIDKNIPMKEKINLVKKYEAEITSKLQKPYALLVIATNQTHVNLIVSDKLKKIINKDDILNGYVVPLLASKDKNTLFTKVSAAVLNGYAEIADEVAHANGIEKLENGIPNSGRTAGTIWKVFMYTLVFIGIFLYTFAVLRSKKK
jgi:hydrogenase maturation factor HypF (carbamoyltransferase family)